MDNNPNIQVNWDQGTAYDLFVSLKVLHDPEKFGLRGSWAAGVRSRLPGPEREFLQEFMELAWPFGFVHQLPGPKDSVAAISALDKLPAKDRLAVVQARKLTEYAEMEELLVGISERGSWTNDELERLTAIMQEDVGPKLKAGAIRQRATNELKLWSNLEQSGELLLSALIAYYEQFYAEEERRIGPILLEAMEKAQYLAADRTLSELLEELSQGLRVDKELNFQALTLVPSFWATPLMIFSRVNQSWALYLFGARPSGMSLIPGDVVPDALYQALRALADPTRLRILRYLTEEPSTPADLARRLRLRSPTVIHHLHALRLARLVQLTLSEEGKRYAIRADAVDQTFALLNDFLGEGDSEVAVPEEEAISQ